METTATVASEVRRRARELVERVDDARDACATLASEFGVSEDAARQLVLGAQVRMFQDLAATV